MTTTTIPVRNATGGQNNLLAIVLADGVTTAMAHMTVDTTGAPLTPAQDSTMQAATTALQSLVTMLSGQVVLSGGSA